MSVAVERRRLRVRDHEADAGLERQRAQVRRRLDLGLILAGGWLRGTMVLRYGMRVVEAEGEPVSEAVKPTHGSDVSIREDGPGSPQG